MLLLMIRSVGIVLVNLKISVLLLSCFHGVEFMGILLFSKCC
jgi:hypothetical protein